MSCRFCEDTGIEPCPNCDEREDHDCHLDGVEYGPSPCRAGCYPNEKDGASMKVDPATIVKLRNLREELWYCESPARLTTRDHLIELVDILIDQLEQGGAS